MRPVRTPPSVLRPFSGGRPARRALRPATGLACVIALSVALSMAGCSSREETPTARADSTLAYASKTPGGVEATITFCRKIGKKSGKRFGAGQVFTMGEREKVRALIDLENPLARGDGTLMFHLDWIGPGEKSIYRKRVDWTPSEESPTIASAISIPPGRRDPGAYALKVYLFRELIAEKRFEVLGPPAGADADAGAKDDADAAM